MLTMNLFLIWPHQLEQVTTISMAMTWAFMRQKMVQNKDISETTSPIMTIWRQKLLNLMMEQFTTWRLIKQFLKESKEQVICSMLMIEAFILILEILFQTQPSHLSMKSKIWQIQTFWHQNMRKTLPLLSMFL